MRNMTTSGTNSIRCARRIWPNTLPNRIAQTPRHTPIHANFHRARPQPSNLVDVPIPVKETSRKQIFAAALILCLASPALAQAPASPPPGAQPPLPPQSPLSAPPPSSVGIFPLAQVHRGLRGIAWTVFEGTIPEPMDVEILGVLRGARGPGKDMILARLHGQKAEFTGVVAGMSGSPVYIEGRLLGALSYRIGQFSKQPIAGITPIADMLEVRDMPTSSQPLPQAAITDSTGQMTFQAMETPLLMSGFSPEAIRVWKDRMAGTGLETISAGGPMGQTSDTSDNAPLLPGSAVSLQLVRGDLEIAATCTVTYIDPTQLLACGHPVLQAGPVSLPMTTAEVVATLASPLNAFKIINTGRTIGAFTQDRASAIRGELGVSARMIPVSLTVSAPGLSPTVHHLEVLDLAQMTPSALLVSIYQILLENNLSTSDTSYHVTGSIAVQGLPSVPVDVWGTPSDTMASQLQAAFAVADAFNRLYTNSGRTTPMQRIDLHVQAINRDMRAELESVRLVSSGIVHAGDTVTVEATIRPFHGQTRNLRLPFTLPSRLEPATLRLLVSGSAALDRTIEATRPQGRPTTLDAAAARLNSLHAPDQLYVTLLLPESQAAVEGQTLSSLPLSMANTLEPGRGSDEAGLHGETISLLAQAPAGGVLNGQLLLNLRVEAGGGLH